MEARQRQKDEEVRQSLAVKREKLAELAKHAEVFDYDLIGYSDAVVAYSVMLTSDEACERGTFLGQDVSHFCAAARFPPNCSGVSMRLGFCTCPIRHR